MRARPLAILSLLFPIAALAQGPERRTVSVTGSADVRVQPDHVVLELGVEVKDPELAAATKECDLRFERVLAYLRGSLGAPNVRTDYVSIAPSYQWDTGRKTYFTAQRSIVATLRDPSRFDRVLEGCLARGATNVHGVQFRTSELKKHREAARTLAVRAAREKAQKLAAEAGVRVGKVLSINESSWGGWSTWYPGSWGHSYGNWAANAQISVPSSPSAGDDGPRLALGEIPVSATVQMTFEIE